MDLYNLQKRFEILARVDPKVYSRLANRLRLARFLVSASVKSNLNYLTGINLNELSKQRPIQEGENVKSYYKALTEEAQSGPVFSEEALLAVKHVGDIPKERAKDLANLISKDDNPDLDSLDFVTQALLRSSRSPSQTTYTQFLEALRSEVGESLDSSPTEVDPNDPRTTEEGKKLIVYSFKDGYFITEVPVGECRVYEGTLMNNCIKGMYRKREDITILSLRDPNNKPHVSMSMVRDTKSLIEIRGKNDEAPVPKYLPYIREFIALGVVKENIVYWALFNKKKFNEEIRKPVLRSGFGTLAVSQTEFVDLFDTQVLKMYPAGVITNMHITEKQRSDYIYEAIVLKSMKLNPIRAAVKGIKGLRPAITKACHKYIQENGSEKPRPYQLVTLYRFLDEYTIKELMKYDDYLQVREMLANSNYTSPKVLKPIVQRLLYEGSNGSTEEL